MLGAMPITLRVMPDSHRKRPATESFIVTEDSEHDVSIPFAKRLHTDSSTLGNGDPNQVDKHTESFNGRLIGVLPNGVQVHQLNGKSLPPIRRKASMNAQIALQLMMGESERNIDNITQKVSQKRQEMGKMYGKYDSANFALMPKPVNGHARLTPEISVEMASPTHSNSDSMETTPVSSPLYRLSPQRLFDPETEGEGQTVATFYQQGKLKQPEIHLVKHQSKRPKRPIQKPTSATQLYPQLLQGGYVKRLASLNAAACVSALMEPTKKSSSRHNGSMTKSIAQTAKLKRNEGYSNDPSKMLNAVSNASGIAEVARSDQLNEIPVASALQITVPSTDFHMHGETFQDRTSPRPAPVESCSLEELPFVSIGLLHNGGTIHPETRVFYKSDKNLTMSLPARITPVLVPSKFENVRKAIKRAISTGVRKTAKRKTRKVRYLNTDEEGDHS